MTERDGETALSFEGVARRYREGWSRRRAALAELSFELPRGASLALIGPNGAGKSTCLRLAAGLERPDAGLVRIFGRDPVDPRARRAAGGPRVGLAEEGFPFPLELCAQAALALCGRLGGLDRRGARAQAAALVARVGLDPRLRLSAASRGMRRRFALAQAFLGWPELVLLDEPTGGLDAQGFAVLEELLAEARGRGTALVIASHVPALLREHCTEALVLVAGRARARGRTAELLPPGAALADLAALFGGAGP